MHTSTHCTIHRHPNFANPPPKIGDTFDNSFSKSKAENIVLKCLRLRLQKNISQLDR